MYTNNHNLTHTENFSLAVASVSFSHFTTIVGNCENGSQNSEFSKLIARSFIERSGIPAGLFESLAEFFTDTAVTIGGDVEYPIHEALNWKVPQRGQFWQPHKARENLEAFVFRNADGTVWQAILSQPDIKDGQVKRPYRYLAPTSGGNRLYFCPSVDWGAVAADPSIPIVLTEGGKKALATIGQGYVAISGFGCSCFVDKFGNLNPDLLPYAAGGREFLIGFDRDTKPKTVKAVNRAIGKLGKTLTDRGCTAKVVLWDAGVAKGIDDVLVAVGAEQFKETIDRAIPYAQWVKQGKLAQARQRLGRVSKPDIVVNDRLLSTVYKLPPVGDVCLISAMGTGKTELVGQHLATLPAEVGDVAFIGLFHRISLATSAADRFGCDLINDRDNGGGFAFNNRHGRAFRDDRVCACVDSLLAIPTPSKQFILFIDEFSKVLQHLLIGATCKDKRGQIIAKLVELMKSDRCVGVIAADADLTDREIDFIAAIRGERPTVVLNQYQETRSVRVIDSPTEAAIIGEILRAAAAGARLFVPCAQKSTAITIDALLRAQGVKTLLLHADNTGEPDCREFKANPDAYLDAHKPQAVIASPTIAEGVSITGNHFDRVYGVFNSKSIDDASVCQFLRRYRPTVPMTIWVHRGTGIPRTIEQLQRTDRGIGEFTVRMSDRSLPVQWQGLFTDLAYAYKADREYSLANLQACVIARLESQGYQVEVVEVPHDRETAKTIKETQKAARHKYHQDVANAPPITEVEAQEIERKIKHGKATEQNRLELVRHILAKFYATAIINPDEVAFDRKGKTRSAIRRGEFASMPDLASAHDREALNDLFLNGGTILPTDLPNATAINHAFHALRLDELAAKLIGEGLTYTQYTPLIKDIADRALACAHQVRELFGFTPSDRMSATDIVGRLLASIGLKTKLVGHLTDPETGIRTRYYSLDWEDFQIVSAILRRRHDRRVAEGFKGVNTPLFNLLLCGGRANSENPPNISPPPPKIEETPPDRGELVAIS